MASNSKQKKAAARSRRKQAEQNARKKKTQNPVVQQLSQTQGALMNLRQMYDQKVMEVESLRHAIQTKDRMLAAILATRRGKTVTFPTSVFGKIMAGEYSGIDVDEAEEGKITLTLVKAEPVPEDEDEQGQ